MIYAINLNMMMKSLKTFAFVFGIFVVYAQTMMLRELFAVYGISELLIALILFFWLLWGAIGSFFYRKGSVATQLSVFGVWGILLPIIIRLTALYFRPVFGLATPLWNVACAGFLSSSVAFFGGRTFAALSAKGDAAKLYAFEGLGAFTGGILSILFIGILHKPGMIFVALILLIAVSSSGKKAILRYIIAVMVAVVCMIFITPILGNYLWRGFSVIERESPYGRIALLSRQGESFIYENGRLVASESDTLSAEQIVHPVIWAHPEPENVLLIGGIFNGAIKDILKHNPQNITVPFADKKILKMSLPELPSLKNALDDKRVSLNFSDPRMFLRKSQDEYDIILLMPGFPATGGENRFWTIEFFEQVKGKLSDEGIVASALPVGANYLSEYQSELCASAWKTFTQVFPDAEIYFLDGMVLFASLETGKIALTERLFNLENLRPIETGTVPKEYLPILFQSQRGETLKRQLESAQFARINHDWRPLVYLWGILEQALLSGAKIPVGIFQHGERRALIGAIFITVLLVALTMIFHKTSPLFWVVAGGMWGMLSQTLFLLLFQANFGSLYWLIGLATGVFLLGSSCGSLLGGKLEKRAIWALIGCFAIIILLVYLGGAGYYIPLAGFFGLFALSGIISGLIFGSASATVVKGGKIYGADLSGAAIGTLAALYIIPTTHPIAIAITMMIMILLIGVLAKSR